MPVEIKELHIKVTVNAPENGSKPGGTALASMPQSGSSQPAADKEAMIAECVEQVLQILRTKQER